MRRLRHHRDPKAERHARLGGGAVEPGVDEAKFGGIHGSGMGAYENLDGTDLTSRKTGGEEEALNREWTRINANDREAQARED